MARKIFDPAIIVLVVLGGLSLMAFARLDQVGTVSAAPAVPLVYANLGR